MDMILNRLVASTKLIVQITKVLTFMLILAFADDVKTFSIHIGHQCLYDQLETHK